MDNTAKITKTCPTCRKRFVTWRCEHEKGWGTFCSVACRGKSQRTSVERICEVCKTTFLVPPSFLIRRGKPGGGRFCSAKCRANSKPTVFWSKVNKTDSCWLWTGRTDKWGYGMLRHTRVHRYSYELAYGEFESHLFVLHHCDNPRCVRPDHLFLGTQLDNMRDMLSKNRQRYTGPRTVLRGETHPNSLLSEDGVRLIRQLAPNTLYRDLAERFGVTKGTIRDIVSRRSWVHIE